MTPGEQHQSFPSGFYMNEHFHIHVHTRHTDTHTHTISQSKVWKLNPEIKAYTNAGTPRVSGSFPSSVASCVFSIQVLYRLASLRSL